VIRRAKWLSPYLILIVVSIVTGAGGGAWGVGIGAFGIVVAIFGVITEHRLRYWNRRLAERQTVAQEEAKRRAMKWKEEMVRNARFN
jgi:transposase